ncbi:MAG: hypothetical protein E6G01_11535 [Actinobacteria bacterium]|nr:MAG: hypothetical protein E6G01_11535 [Actinomycetota bacterium]
MPGFDAMWNWSMTPKGRVGPAVPPEVGSAAVPRRSAAALVCALAAAAGLLAGCSSGSSGGSTASAFLSDWSKGNLQSAAGRTGAPDRAVADLQQVTNDLQVTHADLRLGTVSGSRADFSAALTLAGLGVWRYQGHLGLRQTNGGHWIVAWAPSDIYPGLGPGQRLGRTRTLPPRGAILDRTGAPLVLPTAVVTVGIVPGRLTNPAAAIAALQATTGSDPARVQQLLAGAKPDQFLPVITLRQADYAKAKPVLFPIPGLSFQQKTENLPPTPTFGRAVLGQLGQATADALKQAGPGFEASDDVGLSGLELAYQRQLAGAPSGSVNRASPCAPRSTNASRTRPKPPWPPRRTPPRSSPSSPPRVSCWRSPTLRPTPRSTGPSAGSTRRGPRSRSSPPPPSSRPA